MVFAVMRKGKKMCNEQTIQQTDFAEQWITKQAAIDALGDMVMNWTDSEYELGQLNQWKADRKAIIDLPSAQPQRMRGKWINVTKTGGAELWKCSECGELELENSYFCPNCGSDNRGE